MFNKWLKEIRFDPHGKTIVSENLLNSIVVSKENGELLDFNVYLKTVLMKALEEILGGDKNEGES